MAVYKDEEITGAEKLFEVAQSCALAAKKAPKTAKTEIKTAIVTGGDLGPVADVLEILGEGSAFIRGDALVVRKMLEVGTPPVLLLIGVDASTGVGWNCGACGFATCAEFNKFAKENAGMGSLFMGPSCAWKVLDHAIATSWAAATCCQHKVDNRIQASTGVAAFLLRYIEGCTLVFGVTMGPAAESVYYNRDVLRDLYSEADIVDMLMRNIPTAFEGFAGDGWPKIKHRTNWFDDWRFSVVTKVPEIEKKAAEIGEKLQKYLQEYFAKKQQAGEQKQMNES